ncbi:MAG: exodeoxyribonuclease III [Bacilli bacterium]|nr:exodeoxyribonuclease III [Bacilli bacterium]
MKIVSWNVAGFRACLNKGFDRFFNEIDADIVCLQEVKATQDQISFDPIGYYSYLYPAEKKGYSGTLIYTKEEPLSYQYGMGIEKHDHEGRLITLTYEKFHMVCMYTPNVKRDLSRLEERMQWEDDLLLYLKELEKSKPVILCGDFNVAHTFADIKNAKQNVGNAGFTDEERHKFTKLLENGFIDTYRHFHPDETDKYTWWSYMGNVRERNIGWRIDYFLVSKAIIEEVKETNIYDEVYGSDHCPIGLTIF